MRKPLPCETGDSAGSFRRRRRGWLASVVSVWPIAVLLGGEAWGVGEVTPAEQTGEVSVAADEALSAAAPADVASAEAAVAMDPMPLRGRLGARLAQAAPAPPTVEAAVLDIVPTEEATPLSALAAVQFAAASPPPRAWPPVGDAPRRVSRAEPAAATPPPPPPTAQQRPPPTAQQRPTARSAWPAIPDRAPYIPTVLATPAIVAAVALDPLGEAAATTGEAAPAEDAMVTAISASTPAPAATTPVADVAEAPAEDSATAVVAESAAPVSPSAEDLEIILTPATARPERDTPRVWPMIQQEEPDTTAFEPIVLPNGMFAETLAMAVADALEQNPEIQIAAAQRDDAHFGVQEARAALLPTVDLQAANGHERTSSESGDTSDHTRSEVLLSVRQNLYDFGVARNNLDSAGSVADSADWAFRAQLDAISLEIAQAFLQVLERQSVVALSEQNLASHDAILETVRTQQEFGLVTGADVSRVEARLNAARADLLDQRSALAQAQENFRRLLNRAPGMLAEPVRVEALIPVNADDAVSLLDEMNPAVMQATLLLESLEEQRDSQRAGYMPRFDLEVTSSARENAGGSNGRSDEARAMINMRMPLFDGGAREAAIGRVNSRIRQAEFEVERARRDGEQAVRNDYTALSAAREKIDAIEGEVAAAERLVQLYDEQFRQGSRSVFDLLDGQSTLYQAQVRRETNRTEMRLSGYRVLRTLGILFETITTPASQIPQLEGPTPAPRPIDAPASSASAAAAGQNAANVEAALRSDGPAAPAQPLPPAPAPAPAPPPATAREDDAIILLPNADEAIGNGARATTP